MKSKDGKNSGKREEKKSRNVLEENKRRKNQSFPKMKKRNESQKKNQTIKKTSNFKRVIIGFLSLNIIWGFFSMLLESKVLPSPLAVYIKWSEIFVGELLIHLGYSMWRIFAGILLGLIVGITMGVVIGYYEKIDRLLSPLVYFIYPVPKIAFIPIIMIALGLGEWSKIFIIFLVVVFQIIVAVRDAVNNIHKENLEILISLGASDFTIIKEAILPAIMPKVLSSIRVGLATSISVLFFAENFGTRYGMGYFIMDSMMRINYVEMYAGIVTLSVLGVVLFYSVDWIEGVWGKRR